MNLGCSRGCRRGKELNTLRSWQRSLWEPCGGFFKPIPPLRSYNALPVLIPALLLPHIPRPYGRYPIRETPKFPLTPLFPLSPARFVPVGVSGGAGRARGRGCELCQPAQMPDSLSHAAAPLFPPLSRFLPWKSRAQPRLAHVLLIPSPPHPCQHLLLLVLGMGEQPEPTREMGLGALDLG